MHIDADSFVVAVDACPVRGFASHAGAAHRGEDRADDLVAQGEQGGDRACGGCSDVLAPGAALFAAFLYGDAMNITVNLSHIS